MMDDRAVSMSVQYVILLSIVALLSAGLFATTGGFVHSQQDLAVHDGLQTVGERLATDLTAADRLAASSGGNGSFEMTVDAPRRIAGSTYLIHVDQSGTLTLESVQPSITVTVPVPLDGNVTPTTVSGGPLVIHYDDGTDKLVIHNE